MAARVLRWPVRDAQNNLIESYDLAFITGSGVNLGEWILFEETTPIAYFTMTATMSAWQTRYWSLALCCCWAAVRSTWPESFAAN